MGTYITRTNIDNEFGAANVTAWSQMSPDTEGADTSRIAEAIADAEQEVEDRFRRSEYAVPFAALTEGGLRPVAKWCAVLAGVWLYANRAARLRDDEASVNRIAGRKRVALEEMDCYLAGMRTLNCRRKSGVGTYPAVG